MKPSRLGWGVFFVAAGVLGYELSLMRVLLVASWHHFAFLVISIALLGFGASGTALCLLRNRLLPRADLALLVLSAATALSMPLCVGLAQHVPVEARILPAVMWRQIGSWVIYWALLGLPFFWGAAAIGLALMVGGDDVPRVYAANLLGSAAGLFVATVAMSSLPPSWLPMCMGGLAAIGAFMMSAGTSPTRFKRRPGVWLICVAAVAAYCWLDPPHIRVDPYKYGAYVERLDRQGTATRVAVCHGVRATVEAYRGESFHDLPFLGVGAAAASEEMVLPSMSVLVADGHLAGSVLDIAHADQADVMDSTLMALPYALHSDLAVARAEARGPAGASVDGFRVLLLEETGGTNIWLAIRSRASHVTVVQPDANIKALLRGPLRPFGGAVLDLPEVSVVTAQPRHFVDHTRARFDLIQLVELESSAAGSGGVGGLAEDHLITVEGIAACFRRLTDDGLLVVTRGIQTPPRDNLKLFATYETALSRHVGLSEPEQHMVVVRDFLAVCTMAKRSAWTPDEIERVRRLCNARSVTPIWFPGIRTDELNTPDTMDGPPGGVGDWYHHAVARLFSPAGSRFIRSWRFDIRPPVDDRPFFRDFCKLASLGELKRAFGDLWLTRTELAFLIVLAALVMVGVVAAVLTVVPLLFVREYRCVCGRIGVLVYFAAIGLGYILLEMTFLSRLTRWIGDPITTAAVTIGGFLLCSGIGSLAAQRLRTRLIVDKVVPRIALGIVATGLVGLLLVGGLASPVGSLPYSARCVLAFGAVAPLGFLMGFPMPAALARLSGGSPSMIPWAWGVNGFASVIAAPAAVAIGMTFGYACAGTIGISLYLLPALLFARLPGRPT